MNNPSGFLAAISSGRRNEIMCPMCKQQNREVVFQNHNDYYRHKQTVHAGGNVMTSRAHGPLTSAARAQISELNNYSGLHGVGPPEANDLQNNKKIDGFLCSKKQAAQQQQ